MKFPTLSRKRWILLAAAAGILLILGLLLPSLIKWVVAGTLGGAAVLAGAQGTRRRANREHKEAIEAERKEIEGLQAEANTAVEGAEKREQDSPQDAVAGLSEDERRARLEEAASKLR